MKRRPKIFDAWDYEGIEEVPRLQRIAFWGTLFALLLAFWGTALCLGIYYLGS